MWDLAGQGWDPVWISDLAWSRSLGPELNYLTYGILGCAPANLWGLQLRTPQIS